MSDNPEYYPEFLKQVLSKAGVQIGGYIHTIINWNFDEREFGDGSGSDGGRWGPNTAVERRMR